MESDMSNVKYKRILLKLSGEALAAGADGILNFDFITEISDVLKKCVAEGVEIGIIVGAQIDHHRIGFSLKAKLR